MCVICFSNISIKMVTFSAWKVKLQLSVKLTRVQIILHHCQINRLFCLLPSPIILPPPFGIFPLPKMLQWWRALWRKIPFRKGKKVFFEIGKGHPRPVSGDQSNFYASLWCQRNSQAQPGISAIVCVCNLSQTSVSELNKPQGRKAGTFPPEWLFK